MIKDLEKRNGRIVIHSRKGKDACTSEKKVTGLANSDGLVALTPTEKYAQSKEAVEHGNRGASKPLQQPTQETKPKTERKKKHKKGKSKNKKKFKNKKRSKKMANHISTNLSERSEKSGNLMAELLKHSDDICVVGNALWLYERKIGCFHQCIQQDVASKLRTLLNDRDKLRVTIREYNEAYQQLLITDELKREVEFFANKPYVNCLNGVVDVCNNALLEHSSHYMFQHCIYANYNPEAECKRFLEYIKLITGGDKELRELLRVVIGYLLSHYNNSKMAFILYGIPHTGKSVLCKVLEVIIGLDYVCHVDLFFLSRQEYAASLSGKLLNIAPDLSNEPIKDIGFFKSLVSHDDTITARLLYSNPAAVKGPVKMLFSTNHLIPLDTKIGQYDAEAFFNRLIYIPFQNERISEFKDNKHFSEDILKEERDGIFTWAMGGLRQYIASGERFPKSKLSSDLKADNMANYYPEKAFFDKYLKMSEGEYVSCTRVKDIFDDYCPIKGNFNINRYLTEHLKIKKSKKRLDTDGNLAKSGNPIAVYEGLKLRKQYRS